MRNRFHSGQHGEWRLLWLRGALHCAKCVAIVTVIEKCKECGYSLPKKAKPMVECKLDPPEDFNYNVSSLLTSGVLPAGSRVYSVRVRSQGPDYRYEQKIVQNVN